MIFLKLDLFRNSICLLKWIFFASFLRLYRLSKFGKKFARKSTIIISKANFEKSLLLLSVFSVTYVSGSSDSCQHKTKKGSRADYVIVGLGTSGAILAKELSDDKKTSVIALHNGKNLSRNPNIQFSQNIPTTVLATLAGVPPLSIIGFSPPQPYANNQELLWVLSLPLGGGSSVNAGAYCRGTNQDFAQWEALAGPDWSVDRILATYKQLENYNGKTSNPAARGFRGPINILQEKHPSKVALKFTQAEMQATGFPFVLDYNDPLTPTGISSQVQYTQRGPDGFLRVSSNTAFLGRTVMTQSGRGVDGRKLRVLFESSGLKAIWSGNKAIGVEYVTRNGKIKKVYANKGVIVCAGLFSSTFLMHSGVGSKQMLESFNIPVVYDNPNVGQYLNDQPHVLINFSTNPADTSLSGSPNRLFTQFAWLPSPGGDPNQRLVRLATVNPFPGFVAMTVDLCRAQSFGNIKLASADPLVPPIIDVGELTNSNDLDLYQSVFEVYIKGINNALKNIDSAYQLVFPDPQILDDPAQLRSFIQKEVGATEHFQSHCRMAPLDQGGVVDSSGRVYGVSNLFVADNSINPIGMDGSPMATGFLVGANIARIIIRDHAAP